ncbi:MAG: bifunctional [glutamate--ammonia ligase]-adenylyl-L-tyrosine phosphorylase/[glutamate--ammonia-ligase] adenylyltransferase, partial [Desulfobacterales bacterium]|nr:bifunctional [glutamate--ammonia ligase]-adenylyl-L-tyrosine phosphorylase/[glutamate--ammonia-ligase] adenylyltransferase [Desulfobacterales bacterium]
SSDIDLIFVYPEDGYTRLNGEMETSNQDFFTRLAKRFLALFAMDNGMNFYRVDTRLRPFGDAGPLVMSASAFEDYYQAHGREWERYAMIKAKPVAGNLVAGRALLKALNPFIYRRYFDYGSFDSFRDMKQRISLQVKNAQLKDNIKLGAGGIREVEFFGQLFQLIRGGVEPDLQERGILKVLDLLYIHQCIRGDVRDDLARSYAFLRRVENRLQEYRDLQTHDIPEDSQRRNILALSMGFDDFAPFKAQLDQTLACVHHHFSQLLVTDQEEETDTTTRDLKEIWIHIDDPQLDLDEMRISGFPDPDRVVALLKSLAGHPNTRRLTPSGRTKLARLIPKLLKKAGKTSDAEGVLTKLIDLVITIERRTCYLSLLIENQGPLDTLVILAQKSPWIIHFMSQHPVLLDELMHPTSLYAPPGKGALEEAMANRMSKVDPDDGEYVLEELNIFRQINTLRVAAADISGNYPLMKVSDHLTYIAETVLEQVLTLAWNTVVKKYGLPPHLTGDDAPEPTIENCGFAVIAYGKVGGLEMGYKSDLDLVFLYRGEPGYTAGGQRDIDTVRFYSNLSQRIIHALTLHTSAGTLYGADMRLRPGGDAGMIVSHIEGYEDYLENDAWTWEHQALIRARPITGDHNLFCNFNAVRSRVLCRNRALAPDADQPDLKTEVADMRERMRREKYSPQPDHFDLKQGPGGIVDIEFLVQYLTLEHAHAHPDVAVWTDNIRLLEGLSCEGLITAEESGLLQKAYVEMRQAVHRLTLQEKEAQVPEDRFMDTAKAVAKIYQDRLGTPAL